MKSIYSVSQVNAYIKNMFMQDFLLTAIAVKGEVSNCKYHSSGHIYFTLKDHTGSMACIMFAGNRAGLSFRLEEGQKVVANGSIEVYERDGKYQLYAKEITLQGAGELYEKYLKLKTEMEEMGMFSETYKKPIPSNCKTIGVVTAPTGAAVQDIIQIVKRRNPSIQIILFPAVVQGEKAAESIAKGIQILDHAKVDVIIVGRGGGSIEDLWAFNEPVVAQAIFDAQTPIISAVGHETDTTIADFVADLRAATPSAAAELAVMSYQVIFDRLLHSKSMLQREMTLRINIEKKRYESLALKLSYNSPKSKIRESRVFLMNTSDKLRDSMQIHIKDARHRMSLIAQQLSGLSPASRLVPGYGYITEENGKHISGIHDIYPKQKLKIKLHDGTFHANVLKMEETDG